jgi:hypothetical protein
MTAAPRSPIDWGQKLANAVQAARETWTPGQSLHELEELVKEALTRQAAADGQSDRIAFAPGHTYRRADGRAEFTCERVLDGIALGYETESEPGWTSRPRPAWRPVIPGESWHSVAKAEV